MSELTKCRCGAAADVPEDRGDYYRIECLGECDFYVSAPTIEGVVSVWNSLMHPPREGMTNETTPDAVEAALCKAFEEFLAKRARRTKEVARLARVDASPAPDAVTMLQRMHARAVARENRGDVPHTGSDELLAVLRAAQAERARHAEEVATLRAQLWEAEGPC